MLYGDPIQERHEVVVALINTQEFSALEDVEVTATDLGDRDGIPVVLGG